MPKVTAKAAKAGEAERRPVDFVYGFRWKGFKFTKVWTNGTHTGWEVTCYAQHHFNPKNMCRRTRSFVNQNEDMILRKLKHWCLHDALSRIKQRSREDARRGSGALGCGRAGGWARECWVACWLNNCLSG